MARDPFELDVVTIGEIKQPLPEVGVLGGGAGDETPAFLSPAMRPTLVHGTNEVLGVAMKVDFGGRPFDMLRAKGGRPYGFEADDGGEELHAVVGGAAVAFGELPNLPA